MHFVAEIRDPVHGYIKVTEAEKELIDSVYLQRLRFIKQLASAYLVYPGATHTRFEHVLGSMHIAGKIGERLYQLGEIDRDTIYELRIAALLHDVGHGPFSHTFDEVLSRLKLTHEDISSSLIKSSEISDILGKHGFSSSDISQLAVGRKNTKREFLNEVISGSLSSDIMDYLPRDSYFTGVEYGKVDIARIIDSLHVVKNRLALDRAAIYAFEALLIARYEMFKAVYFHRTVRAAQLMLIRALNIAEEELRLTERINGSEFLELTDDVILSMLLSLRKQGNVSKARSLAEGFRTRRLLKCVYENLLQWKREVAEFEEGELDKLEEKIALYAKLDPRDVYIDYPIAPSIPYSPFKQMFKQIVLVDPDKKTHDVVPVSKIPLMNAISGYINIIRVYTNKESRRRVGEVLSRHSNEFSKLVSA